MTRSCSYAGVSVDSPLEGHSSPGPCSSLSPVPGSGPLQQQAPGLGRGAACSRLCRQSYVTTRDTAQILYLIIAYYCIMYSSPLLHCNNCFLCLSSVLVVGVFAKYNKIVVFLHTIDHTLIKYILLYSTLLLFNGWSCQWDFVNFTMP